MEISVICLTYNSDLKKTLSTINSVISQKDCVFELIIADDGSKENKFDAIEEFLKSRKFTNYKLRANATNNGIICNYLSAIELAKGVYIKYISPGDYLYDEFTLSKCFAFMKKYNAEYAFGKALYYREINNNLEILGKSDPVFTDLYDSDKVNYDYNTVLKYNLLYQDYLLGAGVIVDRMVFGKYLGEVVGRIRYIEDNTIVPLLTLDKKRIWFFPEYILWYECDSGISTNKHRGFQEKINLDFLNCYELLMEKYSYNSYVYLAYLRYKFLSQKNRILVSMVKRVIDLFYGGIKYRRIRRRMESNRYITVFNADNWYKWRVFE
ncbi:MAG: glycosyltransferase [Phascolarctobacterium sp.]|nr:glycosyltransferase [Phascolarctobacterium sp.]